MRQTQEIQEKISDIEQRLRHVANAFLIPGEAAGPSFSPPTRLGSGERDCDWDPLRALSSASRRRVHDERRKAAEAEYRRELRGRGSMSSQPRPAHRRILYFHQGGSEDGWEPPQRENQPLPLPNLPVSHYLPLESELAQSRIRDAAVQVEQRPSQSPLIHGPARHIGEAARARAKPKPKTTPTPPTLSPRDQARLARIKNGLRKMEPPLPPPPKRQHIHLRPRPVDDTTRLNHLRRQFDKDVAERRREQRRPVEVPPIHLPSDTDEDADQRLRLIKRRIREQGLPLLLPAPP